MGKNAQRLIIKSRIEIRDKEIMQAKTALPLMAMFKTDKIF